jgi:2,3-bisphosphoglycerate-independent phosphoglycerate mutase
MRRALFFFVDGLGLGPNDPTINPVIAARTPCLDSLLGQKMAATEAIIRSNGALLVPTDATLGIDGLPQSATGQTALLTGVNAPKIIGRHVTAYPTPTLKGMLTEKNIFRQVMERGGKVALANTYTSEYFSAIEAGRLRHGAVTFSALSAGVRLRNLDDLRSGRAVFHDLTNARPRAWGYDIREISPEEAGRNLAGIALDYHLTVFEFFLTDLAAHGRVPMDSLTVVELVDQCLCGVLDAGKWDEMLMVFVSDHGNLEDNRRDVHTRNPVPTLLVGHGREEVGTQISAITDLTPALVDWLAEPAYG